MIIGAVKTTLFARRKGDTITLYRSHRRALTESPVAVVDLHVDQAKWLGIVLTRKTIARVTIFVEPDLPRLKTAPSE